MLLSRRSLLRLAGMTGISWASPKLVAKLDAAEPAKIDLDRLAGTGLYTAPLFHTTPNEHGVHLRRPLLVTNVNRAVSYASRWWPAGGNRVYPQVLKNPADAPEGVLFLLIQQRSGEYLALLPMADDEAYAWFGGDGQKLSISLGTLGRGSLQGEKLLFAWSRATSAYAAIAEVWRAGLEGMKHKAALLREQKPYPEIFRYLGWCSWEAYRTNIDEQKMVQAIHQIEDSGVPIRYFLMDEGHADDQTVGVDLTKFPRGYGPLTANRNPAKIRWFGLWWPFLGAPHGVKPPGELGDLREVMMPSNNGVLVPKPDEGSATKFFDHILRQTEEGGFDFVKIDFMVDALPLYAGVQEAVPTLGGMPPSNAKAIENPFAASALLMRVCERLSAEKRQATINCNWHNAACLFNSGKSVVGRCSEDYQSNQLESAKAHIYHAFSAIPWLGQTAWGDHDMFHSTDKVAAFPMALSKALSGGPIYLSDHPGTFAKPLIEPLCFQDGRILRPIAPGAPVEEDLFYTPGTGRLLRVIAPLANACATVGVFHLESGQDAHPTVFTTQITDRTYHQAAGMVQPYRGPWPISKEGLLVYEWDRKTARPLTENYEVSLSEFGGLLLQIGPIFLGWSVIGRIDKYLCAAAVTEIRYATNSLRFRAEEAGPYAVWSEQGIPHLQGRPLTRLATNLYVADLQVSRHEPEVMLSR
jgi:Raffinose synthase or seed imbibition protein Sip1